MGLFKRNTNRPASVFLPRASSIRSNNGVKIPATVFSQKSPKLVDIGYQAPRNMVPKITLPPAPDPATDPAAYLRSIYAVRERTKIVLQSAKKNELKHFDVDLEKFNDTAKYVVAIIKRDFEDKYSSIPPHGRWQHFEVGGRPRVTQLLQSWPTSSIDAEERARRLVDLFLVSVLLDAGAGNKWSYESKENGQVYKRSEGLAVASLEMFKAGAFSSDENQPYQVDARGLSKVSVESLAKGMQVSETNLMSGLEGRAGLLMRLSQALENQQMFGKDGRPGNMIDYLLAHPTTQAGSTPIIPLPTLWSVLMDGLAPIWPPTRTQINDVPLGDAWPCSSLPTSPAWENIVPFHKLTQWLCYSIMVPMTKLLSIQFAGAELMTGLPEYRNGGLLVDTGLLTLKKADMEAGLARYKHVMPIETQVEIVPMFEPSDDVIVEWRAVTVGFLDDMLAAVNERLHLEGDEKLTLAQMLEAGTWRGGRELAEVSRPNTKGPPIGIISDGTVF